MSDTEATGAAPAVSEGQASSTPAEPSAPELKANRGQETSARINRLLRGGLGETAPASSATPDATASAQPEAGNQDSEWQPPKTKAEFDKWVQAETDRRENKRQRESEAKAKKDQERWDLDNDPQRIVDRRRAELDQEEAQAQTAHAASAFTADLQDKYDRAVLDPLFLQLPDATQQAILKSNPFQGDAYAHRQDLTKAALAALRKQAEADGAKKAEDKLRRNPSIIKQALADLRDESDEPVAVSGSVSARPPDMNTWLRRGA